MPPRLIFFLCSFYCDVTVLYSSRHALVFPGHLPTSPLGRPQRPPRRSRNLANPTQTRRTPRRNPRRNLRLLVSPPPRLHLRGAQLHPARHKRRTRPRRLRRQNASLCRSPHPHPARRPHRPPRTKHHHRQTARSNPHRPALPSRTPHKRWPAPIRRPSHRQPTRPLPRRPPPQRRLQPATVSAVVGVRFSASWR